MHKSDLEKKAEEHCRKPVEFDDLEYTTDSLRSASKTKGKTKVTIKVRTEVCGGTGCRETVRGKEPR